MDFTVAGEMLNKYSLDELEKEVLADVELERGNKQSGCLIALNVLQKADGDKTEAGKILNEIKNAVIAYYDYQIEMKKYALKPYVNWILNQKFLKAYCLNLYIRSIHGPWQ